MVKKPDEAELFVKGMSCIIYGIHLDSPNADLFGDVCTRRKASTRRREPSP